METIEYRTLDKSKWKPGPWLAEPDKKQWQDLVTGYPCLVVRGPRGALCGYVGVSKQHPWHAIYYSNCGKKPHCAENYCGHSPESKIEVHGGLTFASSCSKESAEDSGICHKPSAGEPDDVWWFGFDCGHCNDYCYMVPKFGDYDERKFADSEIIYRNMAYVETEVAALAKQLKEVENEASAG